MDRVNRSLLQISTALVCGVSGLSSAFATPLGHGIRTAGEAAQHSEAVQRLLRGDRSVMQNLERFGGRAAYNRSASESEGLLFTMTPADAGWTSGRVDVTVLSSDHVPRRTDSFPISPSPRAADSGEISYNTYGSGSGPMQNSVNVRRTYGGTRDGGPRRDALLPGSDVELTETVAVSTRDLGSGSRVTTHASARVETPGQPHSDTSHYRLSRSDNGRSVEVSSSSWSNNPSERFTPATVKDIQMPDGSVALGMSVVPNREGATIRIQAQTRSGEGIEYVYQVDRASGEPRFVIGHPFDLSTIARTVEHHIGNRPVPAAGAPAGGGASGFRGFGGAPAAGAGSTGTAGVLN